MIVDGAPKSARDDFTAFSRYLLASGGYFQTLGIPLLRGRTFAAVTDSLAPRVAIVNLAMAKRWWPSGDALGKTLRIGSDTAAPYTVIGIVGDVREGRIDGTIQPQLYLPVERQGIENTAIVARGTLPPNVLLARLRDAVRAVDPAQAIYNLRMMDEVVSRSAAPRRTNTTLIALFGAVALLLSAFGVYAVVSYNVTRRTREFGIRAALGATSRDITALVGREMIGVVGVSLVVGLIASWALARVLSTLLFEVDIHDLPTYMAVPLVLLVPAAVATLIPARRATRVSPTEVMRAE